MDNDADLMQAIVVGDETAFNTFYERHSRATLGVLLRLIREPGDAEDVMQETFLQVWNRAQQYDAERASPAAWLTMIARSRGLDFLRKRRPDTPDDFFDPAFEHDPTLQLVQDESRDRVRQALAQLPPDQRDAIRLAFLGGMTHEQISVNLGVPLGTIKTRIRLGIRRLRALLPNNGGKTAEKKKK